MNVRQIKELFSIQRPSAKFTEVIHSTDFIQEPDYPNDKHYFFVSLYDEEIENNFLSSENRILVHNTYAGSFIYNLGLCYYFLNTEKTLSHFHRVLNYNLKKFYAEQLYHYRNCIFSRAILLETLLYEQQDMTIIFDEMVGRKENAAMVHMIENIGTSIFSFHEMGHLFFNHTDYYWDNELEEEYRNIFDMLVKDRDGLSASQMKELQCDFLGLSACLNGNKAKDAINILIFSYCALGILYSLRLSAEDTIKGIGKNYPKEHVNFKKLNPVKYDFEYQIKPDNNMLKRSMIMVKACEIIAETKSLPIYEKNHSFPLPRNIFSQLLKAIDGIMDVDQDYKRSTALLVAEAFHDHAEGMDFLYLRSKKFASNRDLSLED